MTRNIITMVWSCLKKFKLLLKMKSVRTVLLVLHIGEFLFVYRDFSHLRIFLIDFEGCFRKSLMVGAIVNEHFSSTLRKRIKIIICNNALLKTKNGFYGKIISGFYIFFNSKLLFNLSKMFQKSFFNLYFTFNGFFL